MDRWYSEGPGLQRQTTWLESPAPPLTDNGASAASYVTTLCLSSITGETRRTAAGSQGGWGGLNVSVLGALRRARDPQAELCKCWQTLCQCLRSQSSGDFSEHSPGSGIIG